MNIGKGIAIAGTAIASAFVAVLLNEPGAMTTPCIVAFIVCFFD